MEAYQELEHRWAEFNELDPRGMVACSSGTAALHLAMEVLQNYVGCRDVYVPDFTMIACARAATLAGANPVLIDCSDSLLINKELIPPNTCDMDAMMAVHIYGRKLDLQSRAHSGVPTIEDLAEAHGVKPWLGSFAACWSFYQNKIVAGEEGGAVWFNRGGACAKWARQLRSLGFTEAHDFRHIPRGHNYRMSNAHAELILRSLREYPDNLKRRREIEAWYDAACPAEWRMPPRDAPWVYDMRIPGLTRDRQDELIAALRRAGIEARHAFKPMHEQEEYKGCRLITAGPSKAAIAASEVIYLPLTPGITKREAEKTIATIGRVLPLLDR